MKKPKYHVGQRVYFRWPSPTNGDVGSGIVKGSKRDGIFGRMACKVQIDGRDSIAWIHEGRLFKSVNDLNHEDI